MKFSYLYGQITRGIPYRLISRILHKLDLHYMPKGLIRDTYYCKLTNKTYPKYHHWCKWCGLRDSKTDFNNPIHEGRAKKRKSGQASQDLTNKQ